MPRVFLNRSVQIQPKSWRDIVQVSFSQVLSLMVKGHRFFSENVFNVIDQVFAGQHGEVRDWCAIGLDIRG